MSNTPSHGYISADMLSADRLPNNDPSYDYSSSDEPSTVHLSVDAMFKWLNDEHLADWVSVEEIDCE